MREDTGVHSADCAVACGGTGLIPPDHLIEAFAFWSRAKFPLEGVSRGFLAVEFLHCR